MKRALLLFIILLVTYLLLPLGLKWGIVAYLEDATDCETELADVDLNLWKLQLRAESLRLRHPTEKEGLKAKLLLVDLSLWKLFQKTIVIEALDVEGLEFQADAKQSSLMSLLDVILKSSPPSPPSWHDFISGGWGAELPEITITSGGEIGYGLGGTGFFGHDLELRIVIAQEGTSLAIEAGGLGLTEPERLLLGGFSGTLVFRDEKMFVERAKLTDAESTTMVDGSLGLGEGGEYDLKLDSALEGGFFDRVAKAFSLSEWRGKPALKLQGTLVGALSEPRLGGKLSVDLPILLPDEACAPRKLEADVLLTATAIELSKIELDDVVSGGRIDFGFDSTLDIDVPLRIRSQGAFAERCYLQDDIKDVLDAVGVVQARLKLSGGVSPLSLAGGLKAQFPDEGAFEGAVFDISLSSTEELLNVRAHEKHPGGASLSVDLSYALKSGVLTVKDLLLRQYPATSLLAKLTPFLPSEAVSGALPFLGDDAVAEVSGNFVLQEAKNLDGQVNLELRELAAWGESIDQFSAIVNMKGSNIEARKLLIRMPAGELRGSYRLESLSKHQGSFEATKIELMKIDSWEKLLPGVEGYGALSGSIGGTLERPTFDSQLLLETETPQLGQQVSRLAINGTKDQIVVSDLLLFGTTFQSSTDFIARFDIARSKLEIPAVQMKEGPYALFVKGSLSDQLDLTLSGKYQLSVLSGHIPGLEHIQGLVSSEVKLQGSTEQPLVGGQIHLSSGGASVPFGGSILGVEKVDALLILDGENVEIDRFQGSMGTGSISLGGGAFNVFSSPYRSVRLDLNIKNGLIEPLEGLSVNFDTDISLRQYGEDPLKVAGEFFIQEALYENYIDLGTIVDTLRGFLVDAGSVEKGTGGGEASPVELDLKVKAPGGMLVDTNLTNLELGASLEITGNLGQPQLHGEIFGVDGTFGLRADQFELLAGRITFPKSQGISTDPRLDIVGVTSLRPANQGVQSARISISGTLSNPHVQFSSEGGLNEREIASLVTAGAGGISLVRVSDEKYQFIDLFNPRSDLSLQERVVGITGFENIEIDTTLSTATGEVTPVVRGTRPLPSQFNLNVESELAGEQVNDLSLDYPLTNDLDVILGWRSRSITDEANSRSGQYRFGFGYRRPFRGQGMLPE